MCKTLFLLVFHPGFLSQSLTVNNKKKVIHFSTASSVFTTIKNVVELMLKTEFICKTIVILRSTSYRTSPLYNIFVQKHASRVYYHAGQILTISQTDFFRFALWISASKFEFMNSWVYVFLEVIVNFSLNVFTFHELLQTKGANFTFSTTDTLLPNPCPRHLVTYDRVRERT